MRRVLAALGGAAVVLGLLSTAGSSLVPVAAAARALGNDYLLLAAIGGIAALAAIAATASGRAERMNQASTPDPEGPVTVPPAGGTLDESLSSWQLRLPVLGAGQRETVRDRLRAAAVGTVRRSEGCSRTEAAAKVADGEWTDDDHVARFLAEDDLSVVATVRTPSIARRTVAVVESLEASESNRGEVT